MARQGRKKATFDPILLAVLSSRFESIIREMTNTVMKASRSSVIKNARDMSCGILTYDHRLVSVEEALPIHVNALELTTKPITELFDDVKEGDAFLNNSPFYGVTHHADLTLASPFSLKVCRCSGRFRDPITPTSARRNLPPICLLPRPSTRRGCIFHASESRRTSRTRRISCGSAFRKFASAISGMATIAPRLALAGQASAG